MTGLRWSRGALLCALACATAPAAAAAPDVSRPSDMLLTVYTDVEHRERLAIWTPYLPGVKALVPARPDGGARRSVAGCSGTAGG